jgi:hypothetical protein
MNALTPDFRSDLRMVLEETLQVRGLMLRLGPVPVLRRVQVGRRG